MMQEKLKEWIEAAADADNLLAMRYLEQVLKAYENDFGHQLTSGYRKIRDEVDKYADCPAWWKFFQLTYEPHHPIHNLSQIALWD